jgi:hypothetical protein
VKQLGEKKYYGLLLGRYDFRTGLLFLFFFLKSLTVVVSVVKAIGMFSVKCVRLKAHYKAYFIIIYSQLYVRHLSKNERERESEREIEYACFLCVYICVYMYCMCARVYVNM